MTNSSSHSALSILAMAVGILTALGSIALVWTSAARLRSVDITEVEQAEVALLERRVLAAQAKLSGLQRGGPENALVVEPVGPNSGTPIVDESCAQLINQVEDLERRLSELERQRMLGIQSTSAPSGLSPQEEALRTRTDLVEALAEYQSRFLDPRTADSVRVEMLQLLRYFPDELDARGGAILSGAIEMLNGSADPKIRAATIRQLKGSKHVELVTPLLSALRADTSDDVRGEAAETLSGFFDLPEVRHALEAQLQLETSDVVRREIARALKRE